MVANDAPPGSSIDMLYTSGSTSRGSILSVPHHQPSCPFPTNTERDAPHDGQGGHVERDADAVLELVLWDGAPAADDVARTGRGLDDEALLVELLEDLADDLPDRLQRLDVVLGLVVRALERAQLEPDWRWRWTRVRLSGLG